MQVETERLILREYTEDDWQALLAYHSDPLYGRYYEAKEGTEARVRELVGWFLGWQQEAPRRRFQFAAVRKEEGRLIGGCGIRLRRLVDFGNPDTGYEADIGYGFDPAYWGRGYATEAVRAVIEFGFAELKVHRVWAYCLAENEPSWRLLERLGLRREALLRENEWMRGRWWDTYLYAVLAAGWREMRSQSGIRVKGQE